ncbi:MAG: nitroreductase family protein [Maritimibacter sp.]|nr:nitroreductase family protein [Maritimibacter sp.]
MDGGFTLRDDAKGSLHAAVAAADRPDAAAPLLPLLIRGSQRRFSDRPVSPELVQLLCAAALSAPSKSDLQLRDLIVVRNAATRRELDALTGQNWVAWAPVMIVVCANARRLRQLCHWRGIAFANDHFDLTFNAISDAAICLAWLQAATEFAGLGGCAVSTIRDHAEAASRLLGLPEGVIPIAAFCLGWPVTTPRTSPRLPLDLTVHNDRFDETRAEDLTTAYDRARATTQPFRHQRDTDRFGEVGEYGWSDDKARQYARPQRVDFSDFVRRCGFPLD